MKECGGSTSIGLKLQVWSTFEIQVFHAGMHVKGVGFQR